MRNQIPAFKTSNTSQTLAGHSQSQSTMRHAENAMETNQQEAKITATQNQFGKSSFFATHFASG
jgi:hypothetical protein